MELILVITVLTLLLLVLSILFIVWLIESFIYNAPFFPLPKIVVEQVANKVSLGSNSQFYDLGSGDGRVVRAVSKKYPNAYCVGIEKALLPNILSWIYTSKRLLLNTKFLRQDYNTVSLGKADVVFLYLWPQAMSGILNKLKQELKAEATIICCRFPLPETIPTDTHLINIANQNYNLYIYKAKLIKDTSL